MFVDFRILIIQKYLKPLLHFKVPTKQWFTFKKKPINYGKEKDSESYIDEEESRVVRKYARLTLPLSCFGLWYRAVKRLAKDWLRVRTYFSILLLTCFVVSSKGIRETFYDQVLRMILLSCKTSSATLLGSISFLFRRYNLTFNSAEVKRFFTVSVKPQHLFLEIWVFTSKMFQNLTTGFVAGPPI